MPRPLPGRRCGLCRSRSYRFGCPACELRQPSLFDRPPLPSDEELEELRLLQEERAKKERARKERLVALRALSRPVLVGLVGCAKNKATSRLPARDLYQGKLFRLALDYSLKVADETYILSARHGLVELDEEISPYDLRIEQLRIAELGTWARQVVHRLDAKLPDLEVAVLGLAGRGYLDPIAVPLAEMGWALLEPLKGLGVGARLSWLKRELGAKRLIDFDRSSANTDGHHHLEVPP